MNQNDFDQKKAKQKVNGGCFTLIVIIFLFIYGIAQCTNPKKTTKPQTQTTQTTPAQTQKPQLPPGKYPDKIYYNGYEWGISGKFDNGSGVFAVTQVPTYADFSDKDFLRTAEMVDNSDYKYLEIRFLDQKTSLVLQRGTAQIVSLYGVTAEYGGINKALLWFVTENGKVLRLNEEQMKKYDSQ